MIFFPQVDLVADLYGMSAQTLRRRLHEEGTSFRSVIEGIRRDLSLRQLLKTKKTVSTIAASLGYSETRAFTRAFKQWTGMSPRDYRKTIVGKFLETGHERSES
jgi:AraC-like DNA-binding protein